MQPGTELVLAAKAAIPTMSEPAVGLNLTTASKQLASALTNLLTAMNAANDRLVGHVTSLLAPLDINQLAHNN